MDWARTRQSHTHPVQRNNAWTHLPTTRVRRRKDEMSENGNFWCGPTTSSCIRKGATKQHDVETINMYEIKSRRKQVTNMNETHSEKLRRLTQTQTRIRRVRITVQPKRA